jgi:glycosyltransferase involved in cell wall biosynthesis
MRALENQNATPLHVLELAGSVALYGAERWILALVKNLNRDRIKPIIGAICDDDSPSAPLCEAAERLGIGSLVIEAPGRFDINSILKLRQIIIEHNIAIIHTHGYKVDLLGRLASWGTPCRILTTPHGWTHNADIKLRLYEWLDRALFPFMDIVVPLSEDMHKSIAGLPGLRRKLQLIPNAVDLDELATEVEAVPELMSWKKEGYFVVGFIGRLISAKGIVTLLRAVANMPSAKVRVALLGNGPDEHALKEIAQSLKISERVKFYGYREDRLSFIKGFDVLALPSLSEGIPRCMMEAMGLSIAVVASDIPGCRALIDTPETGILVPPGDESALCIALESLRNNPAVRMALANAGKQRVFNHFSAKRMAKQYEDLFFKMVLG